MTQENQLVTTLKKEVTQIEALMQMNGRRPEEVKALAQQEIGYLEALSITNQTLKRCEPVSVFLAVKAVVRQNLTLDPYCGLVYVKTRNFNAGTPQSPDWKTVLEIQPTANGLLSINKQCGTILDYKRPEVFKDASGKVIGGKFEILKPSVPEPRWETYTFDEDDIYRWQRASHKENKRGYDNLSEQKKQGKRVPDDASLNYSNENYTNFKGGVDPEFMRAKMIRHALKKFGTNPNEQNKKGFAIFERTAPVVDVSKDIQATNDELPITPHEEVINVNEM